MQFFKALSLLSLALGVIAESDFRRNSIRSKGDHHKHVRRCAGNPGNETLSHAPSTARKGGGAFKQDTKYTGEDFLNAWDFFTGDDPTNGLVNYQSKEDAQSKHLAYVDGDSTILAVDDTTSLPEGQKRDSVRITSQKTWSSGLFIADFAKMPVGCSLWPAYWSVGPEWPTGGEIDVLEGVHNQATNQMTLHTSEGCTASSGSLEVTGKPGQSQCATIGGDNTGCAFFDTDGRSYGQGFNDAGGGVYAHLWDSTGIRVWHFARDEVPDDIQQEDPNPDAWGAPAAFWSSDTCDIAEHFHDHSLVIDTTLCGDWAGATYESAGCSGSCASAVSNPENYKDAKWGINYISVYQAA